MTKLIFTQMTRVRFYISPVAFGMGRVDNWVEDDVVAVVVDFFLLLLLIKESRRWTFCGIY